MGENKNISQMSDKELLEILLNSDIPKDYRDTETYAEEDEYAPKAESNHNSESQKREFVRLRDIVLPDGVATKVHRQYFGALLIALASIVLAIAYKEASYLTGFIIALALLYLGISTKYDYAYDRIVELPMICVSASTAPGRNTTRVVFRTDDEIPSYMEFIIPGKSRDVFLPNYAYIVYFRPEKPKELVGYTQL